MEIVLIRNRLDGSTLRGSLSFDNEAPSLYGEEFLPNGGTTPVIPDGRYLLEIDRHPTLHYETICMRGVPDLPEACFQAKDLERRVPAAITLSMTPDQSTNSRVALNALYNRVQREERKESEVWVTITSAVPKQPA